MNQAVFETNRAVAEQLRQVADLLELQAANPFRVMAYRRAADTVAQLDRDLEDLVERQGVNGLLKLPYVGKGLATAIYEIVATGRCGRLERLRGELDAARLFQAVPGIGPHLAQAIQSELQIDSLEALEMAAHDGRLARTPGFGRRRVAAVQTALASLLGRRRAARRRRGAEPEVELLLELDREYRDQAEAGRLPTIAPKRFNPGGEAWLPVWHTQRDAWNFTVLYSNTARAHELNRTRDWVVIYFYDEDQQEGQHTVVTETQGPLAGRRVVRGLENACRAYYARQAKGDAA